MSLARGMINAAGIELTIVALILIGCKAAGCEERKPAPKLDRAEFALLMADAGSRALDVYSTRQALDNGGRETFLPSAIASRPAAMAAVEAGDMALQYWVARRLEKAHHPRLAHVATLIDLGADLPWAIHNLTIKPPAPAPHFGKPRPVPVR